MSDILQHLVDVICIF